MPEQRENSVLFSLKELRKIEDDRLRQETAEAEARVEAEIRAREDAERRAREDAQRFRQDEEDRVRRAEEEKANREREEHLRLQEAERRARVEGEMQIQQERMRLEVQGKKGKSPLGPVLAVTVTAIVLGGGLMLKMKSDSDAALREREAKMIEEKQRFEREAQEERRKWEAKIAQKEKELREAKTDEERARIRQEIASVRARPATPPPRMRGDRRPSEAAPAAARPLIREKREIKDDPLDGL